MSDGSVRSARLTALREYAQSVRDFSPNARLFLAAATLGGLSSGVSSVLLNLYILSLGYDREFLGRLLSYGPAGAVLGAVLAVPVVYFWSTKRAMLLGITLAGAGAISLLASPAPAALRAGIALTTMGSILFYTAVPPFLTRHSAPRERAHLYAVVVAAYVVSAATGGLAGGYLYVSIAGLWPGLSAADAYRLALFGGALLTATGIPLIALVREEAALGSDVSPRRDASASAFVAGLRGRIAGVRRDVLRPRVLVVLAQFIAADALIRFGGNLVLPMMNVHFIAELGSNEAQFGALRFFERGLVVVATLAVAPLALRYGPVATVVVTQVLSVPLLLVVGYAPALSLAALAYVLRGPLMEMTVPTRDAFLMESMPEQARTGANAAMLLAGYAVAWVALRMSGVLIETWGFGVVCGVTGMLYVASAALYWHFFHATPQAIAGRVPRYASLVM